SGLGMKHAFALPALGLMAGCSTPVFPPPPPQTTTAREYPAPRRTFFVTGEVRSPGHQMYINPITLTMAIENAGGFTAAANRERLTVHRANGVTEHFSYQQILKTTDPPVYPGDTVDVQKRKFAW